MSRRELRIKTRERKQLHKAIMLKMHEHGWSYEAIAKFYGNYRSNIRRMIMAEQQRRQQ